MRMTSARRWAWVTLALGLAIAGTGGGLYGAAVSRNAEYVQNREDFEQGLETGWDLSEFNSRADSGEGLEGAGWALMGVGLASLVTSIVLFAAFDGTENVPNDGGQSLLSLKLGDGLLGFSVSGSF